MSNRVFISYASSDMDISRRVSAQMQAAGLTSYLAPRDIMAGTNWLTSLVEALEAAPLLVLILSAKANTSKYVIRELMYATDLDLPIVQLRVENVLPQKDVKFLVGPFQWIDGFPPPIEQHLPDFIKTVHQIVRTRTPTPTSSESLGSAFSYMMARGPTAHRLFSQEPAGADRESSWRVETIANVRDRLLHSGLRDPFELSVSGTLFPSARLAAGWWQNGLTLSAAKPQWRDPLQEWLFDIFNHWGPSWDFSWQGQREIGIALENRYFLAQIGYGDEVDSLPVLLPNRIARHLWERFAANYGPIEVEIRGLLGHRRHFERHVDQKALKAFGGLMDYCLWLDADNEDHQVLIKTDQTEIFTGYIWKCMTPSTLLTERVPRLNDVWFLWEHVNLANEASLSAGLEYLSQKERMIEERFGSFSLVHKSSALVPGEPLLGVDAVYDMFIAER